MASDGTDSLSLPSALTMGYPGDHPEPESCCFQLRTTPDKVQMHPSDESAVELGKNNNNNQFQLDGGNKTFAKKARLDLSFEDVRYSVSEWSLKHPIPVRKEILKGVSGVFPAGELTAIMGPSGAGKSTLLNVLAAFTMQGASGRVMLNRTERDPVKFKQQSCYIQQDDYLRKQLTVAEAMNYAASLKLGRSVSPDYKLKQTKEILELLGLVHCWDTPSRSLSGGQRKRLSIALELISNPPVIFLDEPTTGLDSSSCTLCVSLLKFLAQQGRTVVCTIHQPSSLVFEKFDNVYTLAAGRCLYSGKTKDLVPYLANFGLHCPQYHNPADFLLDVALGDYNADLEKLAEAAQINVRNALAQAKSLESEKDYAQLGGRNNNNSNDSIADIKSASLLHQTAILTCRKLRMIYRSPTNVMVRLGAHLFIGLLFGFLYRHSGENANTVLANYVYLYGSNLFLVYTAKMSACLMFPMELLVVTHEHFNRWYKLAPYYISMMIIELPFQLLCGMLYLPVSYYLTGQPHSSNRLWLFCGAILLLSSISQAMGFLIGILFPRKIAVFIGPCLACLLSIFGFCLRYSDTPDTFKWLYQISYFRSAFHISVEAIYGSQRGKLHCPDELVHCIFEDPRILLREMDATNIDVQMNSIYNIGCFVLLHILTVFVVWYKLNRK